MDKKVTIYSTPGCIYCKMAKEFFQEKNVDYTDFDISTDEEKRNEVIEKTGQMAVPVIDIDGELLVGFDKAKLTEILGL